MEDVEKWNNDRSVMLIESLYIAIWCEIIAANVRILLLS